MRRLCAPLLLLVACSATGADEGSPSDDDASPIDASPEATIDASDAAPSDASADTADVSAPAPTALVAPPVAKLGFRVDGMTNTKAPMLAAVGGEVLLAGTVAKLKSGADGRATVRAKAPSAAAFGVPSDLGDARGQPDYAGTSIHVAADGATSVAFLDQSDEKTRPVSLWFTRRDASKAWTTKEKVATTTDVTTLWYFVDLTTAPAGSFVFTANKDQKVQYARNTGGGWSAQALAHADGVAMFMRATTLADGRPLFVHAYDGAWAGAWTGAAFTSETINPAGGARFLAEPTVAALPDGRAIAAFRSVDPGIWVAERSAAGVWSLGKVFDDKAEGIVAVATDAYGFSHLAWTNGAKVQYAVRPPKGAWSTPVSADAPTTKAASLAVTWEGSLLRAHVACEEWPADALFTRYVMFEATAK